jgi:beta-xylosidase
MIKQILILLILLVSCFWGVAGNDNNNFQGDNSSPAVRNHIKYNYDQVAGVSLNAESNFSDDFNLPQLRSIWQSNIDEKDWTLKERPGFLRIKAQKSDLIDQFSPENSFFQNVKYNTSGEVISYIDLTNLSEDSNAGLYFCSKRINYIGIVTDKGEKRITAKVNDQIFKGPEITETVVLFRIEIDKTRGWFEYSFDGLVYNHIGPMFQLSSLSNDVLGIFCLNGRNGKGSIDIDWFYYKPQIDDKIKFAENEHYVINSEL